MERQRLSSSGPPLHVKRRLLRKLRKHSVDPRVDYIYADPAILRYYDALRGCRPSGAGASSNREIKIAAEQIRMGRRKAPGNKVII